MPKQLRLLLCLCIALGCFCLAHAHTALDTQKLELEFTAAELRQTAKWKDRTFEDLVSDALEGDEAALYMIGMAYLTGTHVGAIDTGRANLFFAVSASLGFAPSIDKISKMYVYDCSNPFLATVYANLTASFWHPELVIPYHTMRNYLTEKAGIGVTAKIEELANQKKRQLDEIVAKKNAAKDRAEFVVELFETHGILAEDSSYGWDYWVELSPQLTRELSADTSDSN